MDPSWSNLIERAKHNEKAAFQMLYQNSYADVYRTVKLLIWNEEIVRETVQDVYVKGFADISSLEDPERFLPWVKRIAASRASEWFRRTQGKPPSVERK